LAIKYVSEVGAVLGRILGGQGLVDGDCFFGAEKRVRVLVQCVQCAGLDDQPVGEGVTPLAGSYSRQAAVCAYVLPDLLEGLVWLVLIDQGCSIGQGERHDDPKHNQGKE
jgi:hypothetical protein